MATLKTHRRYSDINLLFSRHPTTGDVTKKTDVEAIKASVRNIILTKNYERPFHPEIGCQVHSLLFENVTPVTIQVMQRTIAQALEKFEPRVTLDNVVIDPDIDNNGIRVDVYFTINNTQEPVVISTTLTRIR
jgi:phage baseplate assembly protein W